MCDYTQIETLFKTMNNVYSLHHAISFRYCSVHSSQIRADYPRNLAYSATIRNFAVKNIYIMKQEINPKETNRAIAFELWMKSPMPMVTLTSQYNYESLPPI